MQTLHTDDISYVIGGNLSDIGLAATLGFGPIILGAILGYFTYHTIIDPHIKCNACSSKEN